MPFARLRPHATTDDPVDRSRGKAIGRKGHRVKVEPMTTPVCRMSVVLDPEGNALTLHQVTQAW